MRFRFEIEGRARTVEVERTGGPWVVDVDGRRWLADMRPSGSGWSLLLAGAPTPASAARGADRGADPARSYDVRVAWPQADLADVRVDGIAVPVTLARVTARRRPGAAAERRGDGAVRAPMAGRVVAVLAAVGQHVEGRQGLVIVEAMKMENELRAPHDGVVRAVHVAPGDSVDAAEVLVELDS